MSVKLIESLPNLDHNFPVLAMSVKAGVPATDKLVIVQIVNEDRKVETIGARYREGQWYGESGKEDLTDAILGAPQAIWAESILFTEDSSHQHVNIK